MSGQSVRRGGRGRATHLPNHFSDIPTLKLLVGAVLVLFFLMGFLLEIQTSEAFILSGAPVHLATDWAILAQPLDLANGKLSTEMAKAVMWGWGIELVYLVCVIGQAALHGHWHGWFKTGALILVGFNWWTNFNYGSIASGFWGQLAFSGITAFIVAFFGVIGLRMIFEAIGEMV